MTLTAPSRAGADEAPAPKPSPDAAPNPQNNPTLIALIAAAALFMAKRAKAVTPKLEERRRA